MSLQSLSPSSSSGAPGVEGELSGLLSWLPQDVLVLVLAKLSGEELSQARLANKLLAALGKEPWLPSRQKQLQVALHSLGIAVLKQPAAQAVLRHMGELHLRGTQRAAAARCGRHIARGFGDPSELCDLLAAACRNGLSLRALRLETYDLSGTKAIPLLSASGALRRLEALSLVCCRMGPAEVSLLADGAVAGNPFSSTLTSLNLTFNYLLTDAGAEALAASPPALLAGLRSLSLRYCGVSPAGLRALAGCRHLASLAALDLGDNRLTAGCVGALSGPAAPFCTSLTSLGLYLAGLHDEGAAALARAAAALPALTSLCLKSNSIGPAGAAALAAAPPPALARLRSLDLSVNALLPAGAAALAASAALGRGSLARLSLASCSLGDEGAAALCRAGGGGGGGGGALSSLTELNLDSNRLTDRAADELAGCGSLGRLRALSLRSNGVSKAAALRVKLSPLLPQLRRVVPFCACRAPCGWAPPFGGWG